MRVRHLIVITCLTASLCACASPGVPPPPGPAPYVEAVLPAEPVPPPPEDPTETASKLLPGLGSDKYRERERSTRKLRELLIRHNARAGKLGEYLRKRLEEARDPEVRHRLEPLVRRFLNPWKHLSRTRRFEGHTGSVWGVSFSPDGKTLAAASRDNTISLWDPATGSHRRTIGGEADMLNQAVFSPCGRLIAAVDHGSLHIWNARTGSLLASKSDLSYHATSVAFSPCGTALAVAGLQNEIDIWELPRK